MAIWPWPFILYFLVFYFIKQTSKTKQPCGCCLAFCFTFDLIIQWNIQSLDWIKTKQKNQINVDKTRLVKEYLVLDLVLEVSWHFLSLNLIEFILSRSGQYLGSFISPKLTSHGMTRHGMTSLDKMLLMKDPRITAVMPRLERLGCAVIKFNLSQLIFLNQKTLPKPNSIWFFYLSFDLKNEI